MAVYSHSPMLMQGRLYTRVVADTEAELLEYADSIGFQDAWLVNREEPDAHLDVMGTKLRLVLKDPKVQYLTLNQFEEKLELKRKQ